MSGLRAALDFYATYSHKYRFYSCAPSSPYHYSSSQAEGNFPPKRDYIDRGNAAPNVVPDEDVCVPNATVDASDHAVDDPDNIEPSSSAI